MAKGIKSRKHLYDGAGGHYYVMSELLSRGWNVAIPAVDVGDDVFVVKDKARQFLPVQVKSANGKAHIKKGTTAYFKVPISQLKMSTTPELVYIFAVRFNDKWENVVTIDRYDLEALYSKGKFGTENGGYLYMRFEYQNSKVQCSGIDLSTYLNTWTQFPIITNP